MKIQNIISFLEAKIPPYLQESYDNCGLIIGNADWECTGVVIALDATAKVVAEAVEKNCNLVITHHPVIFGGLKKITGKNEVEKVVIQAIKNEVAIYAIHTNLDNLIEGVNAKIADKLGLINRKILLPKTDLLKKLYTFVPATHANQVRDALFAAGGGAISNYTECSFNTPGLGTFLPGNDTQPFSGEVGKRHSAEEIKVEVIFNAWLQSSVIQALKMAHPYEEVAYDIVQLDNLSPTTGSGLIGELPYPLAEKEFLALIKDKFNLKSIKHTSLIHKKVEKVALCGGAGSFLINTAVLSGADFYITSDVKYHDFFNANGQLVIADIGHYESEQFTIDLLFDIIQKKFSNFAVLKTEVNTNPVEYF